MEGRVLPRPNSWLLAMYATMNAASMEGRVLPRPNDHSGINDLIQIFASMEGRVLPRPNLYCRFFVFKDSELQWRVGYYPDRI